jgi:SAM-dependent methyltransferase
MQLLGATDTFADFMREQILGLELESNSRVLDLGSGINEFGYRLAALASLPSGIDIVSADFVTDALRRGRERTSAARGVKYSFCSVDCDKSLPFVDCSFDRVLASLLLSYVRDPLHLLTEIHRLLRPGGSLVLSSPKRDADLSVVYRHTLDDFERAQTRSIDEGSSRMSIEAAQRSYLNDGARLATLEEEGLFHFWDPDELCEMTRRAGFTVSSSAFSLGDPPQAAVVYARKQA